MTLHKRLNVRPNFLLGYVPKADRNRKAAVIRAGFVGAGFAFQELRGRVDWREPFGNLGAEESECGDAAKCGEMAGAGIVADENTGAIDVGQQIGDSFRSGDGTFAGFKPPFALVRITGDLNTVVGRAQASDKLAEAIERPNANRLAGAGMDEDFPIRTLSSKLQFFMGRQREAERTSHHAPVFVAMSRGIWPLEGLTEEQLAPQTRKAEARLCVGQPQKKMIARIPASGQSDFEALGGELLVQPKKLSPGPAEQTVFMFESCPGRDERNYVDVGPKSSLQILRVRFCQDGHSVAFAGPL